MRLLKFLTDRLKSIILSGENVMYSKVILYHGPKLTLFLFTYQVLGNAKGAVAVVVSIMIFKNPVSVTGMLGYLLTVLGVILYSEAKKRTN
uniref:Probable sugar phosphate/phosphate translocator At3g11320 n=1 Tax=Tanacetum cinerariifolium TaxID=118510 RepID=A0A699RRC0_TANCI|nr:probable sugar phosphate/phosphate translocator At3g11320 [Tanacetum cinerariifolium]